MRSKIYICKGFSAYCKGVLYSRENLESGEELGDWTRGEWTPRVELATANQDKIARVIFSFSFLTLPHVTANTLDTSSKEGVKTF